MAFFVFFLFEPSQIVFFYSQELQQSFLYVSFRHSHFLELLFPSASFGSSGSVRNRISAESALLY